MHGIDLSEAMVAKLRAKPGAERSNRSATCDHEWTARLALRISSRTDLNLDADEQVACFRNVAAHLEPGGCFVIEVGARPAAFRRARTSSRST
jgi:hypothetical protein